MNRATVSAMAWACLSALTMLVPAHLIAQINSRPGVARLASRIRPRFIYVVALKIEEAAFWAGWRNRFNSRYSWFWQPVAMGLVRSSNRLKEFYFAWNSCS